uniref:Uncharacterized protein n=1 Tax=Phlebotomus papatasi TaxID=29031 RepID=A0A1B0D7I3_PHLPP
MIMGVIKGTKAHDKDAIFLLISHCNLVGFVFYLSFQMCRDAARLHLVFVVPLYLNFDDLLKKNIAW